MTALASLKGAELVPDENAIVDFLAQASGDAIHLVAIPADGGAVEGKWFGGNARAAAHWAAIRNASACNVYWSVNAVRLGLNKKAAKADIEAVRYAYVDIDPPKGGGVFDKAKAIDSLKDGPIPPSLIVDSGAGVQALWRLDGKPSHDKVEALNHALIHRFGGDPACFNVDRVLRVAGTVNWPNAKKRAAARVPVLASVVKADHAATVTLDRLAMAFPPAPANDHTRPSVVDLGNWEPKSPTDLGIVPTDPLHALLTDPPGDDRSADTFAVACEMVRHGYRDADIAGVLLNPDLAISGHCLDQADPERAAERAITKARAEMAQELSVFPSLGADGTIHATPYDWPNPSDIPPRDWLYGRQLLRGTVSAIVAPGATGKSAYTIGIALSLASGRPLLGKEVHDGPKNVWLWNLEDGRDELSRSIAAASLHYGITPAQCTGRLFVDSGLDGQTLCTAIQTKQGFTILQPVYDAIVIELKARQIECLIVDPFVSSQAVAENDNGAIDAVVKAWARVAAAANCSIVLVHHTAKLAGGEVTAEKARGASAFINAARSVVALNRMTPEEARKLGIPEGEHRWYFRAYDDKNNRAPPADASDWYRLESVALHNGPDPLDEGDSLGVVVPWTPPAAEQIDAESVAAIQNEIAQGEWRESDRADAWAGKAVAKALGWDIDTHRVRIKDVLKTLLKDGSLRVERRKDAHREMKGWIVVGDPGDLSVQNFAPSSASGVCRSAVTTTTADYGTTAGGSVRVPCRSAPPLGGTAAAQSGTAAGVAIGGEAELGCANYELSFTDADSVGLDLIGAIDDGSDLI